MESGKQQELNGQWADAFWGMPLKAWEKMASPDMFKSTARSWADLVETSMSNLAGHNMEQFLKVAKPCLELCVQQQKNCSDLSLAWLVCLEKMNEVVREGQQQGNGPARIWCQCIEPPKELAKAYTSFAKNQTESIRQLCSSWIASEQKHV